LRIFILFIDKIALFQKEDTLITKKVV
jgi:hypothetical protein